VPDQSPDVRPGLDFSRLGNVRLKDYVVRFGLGATISVCAALLGQVVSVRFGGVFLAAPAILPASLTLIQEEEGTRQADRNAIGAVLGGGALTVFAGVGEFAFGRVPAGVALLLAVIGWVGAALLLYVLLAALRPDDCDRARD